MVVIHRVAIANCRAADRCLGSRPGLGKIAGRANTRSDRGRRTTDGDRCRRTQTLRGRHRVLKHCAGPRLRHAASGRNAAVFSIRKLSRAGIAKNFTEQFLVTLLFKGSRTIVAQRDFLPSFNTTGNPGMATGGMGDVLTGVCAGLIGQGLSLYDAARVGAWICGRAAEIAIFENGTSEQSLFAARCARPSRRGVRPSSPSLPLIWLFCFLLIIPPGTRETPRPPRAGNWGFLT